MKFYLPNVLGLLVISCGFLAISPAYAAEENQQKSEKVTPKGPRFESEIQAFIAKDKVNPPAQGKILFIGSSIFRKWTTLTEQMSPLPVYNRGFGGSRTQDVLYRMDQIVFPYNPKIIVYYCGSNDINANLKPEAIVANFLKFSERVANKLPKTKIIYISINKAPQKKDRWDWVEDANNKIKKYCETTPLRSFIDVNPVLLNADGSSKEELFVTDKLHLKQPAYDGFTKIIKPILIREWEDVSTQ
jgi:hypothetical protein